MARFKNHLNWTLESVANIAPTYIIVLLSWLLICTIGGFSSPEDITEQVEISSIIRDFINASKAI